MPAIGRALKREKAKVAAVYDWVCEQFCRSTTRPFPIPREEHLLAARLWLAVECLPSPTLYGAAKNMPRQNPCRLFVERSARLTPSVSLRWALEHHDKAGSRQPRSHFGADDKSDIRARMAAAVRQFIDVREMSDPDVAALSSGWRSTSRSTSTAIPEMPGRESWRCVQRPFK